MMMFSSDLRIFVISAWLLLLSTVSHADLITTATDITNPTVIDFRQFAQSEDFIFTAGPVQIGGLVGENIQWSTTNALSVIGNGRHGLTANGVWNSGRNGYTALNAGPPNTMRYDFIGFTVSNVGGFLNYGTNSARNVAPIIEALDINDIVLESYNLELLAPIVTPSSFNEGAFRGISRLSSDIAAFRVGNNNFVLDDLTFSGISRTVTAPPDPIPEPSTMLLFGTGLLVMMLYVWRRERLQQS